MGTTGGEITDRGRESNRQRIGGQFVVAQILCAKLAELAIAAISPAQHLAVLEHRARAIYGRAQLSPIGCGDEAFGNHRRRARRGWPLIIPDIISVPVAELAELVVAP